MFLKLKKFKNLASRWLFSTNLKQKCINITLFILFIIFWILYMIFKLIFYYNLIVILISFILPDFFYDVIEVYYKYIIFNSYESFIGFQIVVIWISIGGWALFAKITDFLNKRHLEYLSRILNIEDLY